MAAIEPNMHGLIVFLVAWLTGCIGFFFLAGNLPVRAAPKAVQAGYGPLLVWGNVAVFAVLIAMTLTYGVAALRWTSLIVGGGFVFLFAPFIVQDLPSMWKDTPLGLAVLLVGGVLAAGMIYLVG